MLALSDCDLLHLFVDRLLDDLPFPFESLQLLDLLRFEVLQETKLVDFDQLGFNGPFVLLDQFDED